MQVSRQTRFQVESTLVNLRARLNTIEGNGPRVPELHNAAQLAPRTVAPIAVPSSQAYVQQSLPGASMISAAQSQQPAAASRQQPRAIAAQQPFAAESDRPEQQQQPQQQQAARFIGARGPRRPLHEPKTRSWALPPDDGRLRVVVVHLR